MALAQARACLAAGRASVLLARQTAAVAPATFEGHRNLTTNPEYKKPFPYERKGFPYWRIFTDWTTSRLNENSRIIQVEGPPGVGKADLAKKIADEFKLLHMPGITEEDIFLTSGFDKRELNFERNLGHMFYDLKDFYNDTNPESRKMVATFQIAMYQTRFMQYLKALRHLLSTGQGVVLENSVWSDAMYADALFKNKHMSKQAYKWYKEYRHMTLWEFWRPHLVIHLDMPTGDIMADIVKKNPEFASSPNLTEGYIETLRSNYRDHYLPYMSEFSEVLSYDVKDLPDFDILALDLSKLDLMSEQLENPTKFKNWRKDKEEDYCSYRHNVFNDVYFENVMKHDMPFEAPELLITPEQIATFDLISNEIPELKYNEKWNKENTKTVSVL